MYEWILYLFSTFFAMSEEDASLHNNDNADFLMFLGGSGNVVRLWFVPRDDRVP